ncbi:MAG: guanylate kinase [Coriobacteriales bacterium]|jgi:guanylate kinase|nr:guanylate kinase [Coriobacteriales bacterium]
MAGKLFVVSGPSGAGKGTLLARVLPQLEGIRVAVSVTTRQPRIGEREGIDYVFLSDAEFDELIAEDGLLEWATVHSARYGTLKSEVFAAIADGSDVVLEIDPQGARQIKDRYPQATLVFIEPPSLAELEYRLRTRGTESDSAITERLRTAAIEMDMIGDYEKVIVNDDLGVASDDLLNWITAIRVEGA